MDEWQEMKSNLHEFLACLKLQISQILAFMLMSNGCAEWNYNLNMQQEKVGYCNLSLSSRINSNQCLL